MYKEESAIALSDAAFSRQMCIIMEIIPFLSEKMYSGKKDGMYRGAQPVKYRNQRRVDPSENFAAARLLSLL